MAPEGEYTKRGTGRKSDSERKLQPWRQKENTQREGLTERGIPRENFNQESEGEYCRQREGLTERGVLRENFNHVTRGRIHK